MMNYLFMQLQNFSSSFGFKTALIDYNLTAIDDGEVPLSAGAFENYHFFIITVVVVVIIGLLFFVSLYILSCFKYRRHYDLLYYARTGEHLSKQEWNIQVLKDLIREEEAMAVDILLEDENVTKNS